jgi:hypothetical protein
MHAANKSLGRKDVFEETFLRCVSIMAISFSWSILPVFHRRRSRPVLRAFQLSLPRYAQSPEVCPESRRHSRYLPSG